MATCTSTLASQSSSLHGGRQAFPAIPSYRVGVSLQSDFSASWQLAAGSRNRHLCRSVPTTVVRRAQSCKLRSDGNSGMLTAAEHHTWGLGDRIGRELAWLESAMQPKRPRSTAYHGTDTHEPKFVDRQLSSVSGTAPTPPGLHPLSSTIRACHLNLAPCACRGLRG